MSLEYDILQLGLQIDAFRHLFFWKKNMQKFDVLIIGAGAAGLMCAAQAGKRGRRVIVLDNAKKAGRKVLISGGGACNFTNYDVSSENYICCNPHFVKSALAQYTNWDMLSLVDDYEIPYEEREHGQLFCLDSSKSILNMLIDECNKVRVSIELRTEILNIDKNVSGFSVTTDEDRYQCESLVVATGGLSMPKLGATPLGYKIAEQFNISVIPTRAGLVPLTLDVKEKDVLSVLSGISVPAEVTTEQGRSFSEALLFTHRGLSGPVILQVSSYWQTGEELSINLFPQTDLEMLFLQAREKHSSKGLKNFLSAFLPKRLVDALMILNGISDKPIKQLYHKEVERIILLLTQWKIKPSGTEGYRTAEVTLGGVDTDAISSKTMEAKDVSGLYFIGEVLDVAGHLGGFNFQWCWSSGWVCGQVV